MARTPALKTTTRPLVERHRANEYRTEQLGKDQENTREHGSDDDDLGL